MSDFWPTVLELTTPARPMVQAANAIHEVLRARYLFDTQEPRVTEWPAEIRIAGLIHLAGKNVWLEVHGSSEQDGRALTTLTVRLDSKAYELAYDAVHQQVSRKGLHSLLRLCVDLAAASHCEGFRLSFDHAAASPFETSDLLQCLRSSEPDPVLVLGLSATSVHWPTASTLRSGWISMGGYWLKEFFS